MKALVLMCTPPESGPGAGDVLAYTPGRRVGSVIKVIVLHRLCVPTMNLDDLRTGDRVRVAGGAVAEVLQPTQDGRWVLVRHVESPGDPSLVGTEDLCSEEEIIERVARPGERSQTPPGA